MWVKNSKQGWALWWIFILGVICPVWALGVYTMSKSGSNLTPSVRPGKDHAHMAPRIVTHLKDHNYENGTDFIGRRNGTYYKNHIRQVNDIEFKPMYVRWLETHGFKF
jgi:hypothetical protein